MTSSAAPASPAAGPMPRRFRFTLRGLMLLVVVFALLTTVAIQSLRLSDARVREERLRAEMAMERARSAQAQATALQASYQLYQQEIESRTARDGTSTAPDPPPDR